MRVMRQASHQGWAGDEQRWDAVRERDEAADGAFLYGVLTTGVYCRPSCPSRLARRENVRFFASSTEAERAGLRACKRCRPLEAHPAERRAALVTQACRSIADAEEPPNLATLARAAGLSRFHFQRLFKAATGVSPKVYGDACRAERARLALRGSGTVTAAIYEAGFGSSGRFYAGSAARLGMSPTGFRDGGRGVAIRFAVASTSLGPLLVAASQKGLCAVQFGGDAELLVRDLQDSFPHASLTAGDAAFDGIVAQVVGLVETPGQAVDLPLDIQGTAFQERVWQALRAIMPGQTASYAEIAQAIGSPGAVRAVAGACAANRIAVMIPCHRVVRSNGDLSGYRWGVDRKRSLLLREAAHAGQARAS